MPVAAHIELIRLPNPEICACRFAAVKANPYAVPLSKDTDTTPGYEYNALAIACIWAVEHPPRSTGHDILFTTHWLTRAAQNAMFGGVEHVVGDEVDELDVVVIVASVVDLVEETVDERELVGEANVDDVTLADVDEPPVAEKLEPPVDETTVELVVDPAPGVVEEPRLPLVEVLTPVVEEPVPLVVEKLVSLDEDTEPPVAEDITLVVVVTTLLVVVDSEAPVVDVPVSLVEELELPVVDDPVSPVVEELELPVVDDPVSLVVESTLLVVDTPIVVEELRSLVVLADVDEPEISVVDDKVDDEWEFPVDEMPVVGETVLAVVDKVGPPDVDMPLVAIDVKLVEDDPNPPLVELEELLELDELEPEHVASLN
ncbi:hypothetical protein RBB50_004999 [Rhinocladiella similis]